MNVEYTLTLKLVLFKGKRNHRILSSSAGRRRHNVRAPLDSAFHCPVLRGLLVVQEAGSVLSCCGSRRCPGRGAGQRGPQQPQRAARAHGGDPGRCVGERVVPRARPGDSAESFPLGFLQPCLFPEVAWR